MKNFVLWALFCFLFEQGNCQTFEIELDYSKAFKVGESIFICGQNLNNRKEAIVIKLNKDLKEINRISLICAKKINHLLIEEGDNKFFRIRTYANTRSSEISYIDLAVLDTNLKQKSIDEFHSLTESLGVCDHTSLPINLPLPIISGGLRMLNGRYLDLSYNVCKKDSSAEFQFRYTSSSSSKLEYLNKINLVNLNAVVASKVLGIKGNTLFLYVLDVMSNNIYKEYVYCVDLHEKKIKYRTDINSGSQLFTASNAVFDSNKNKILVVGNYIDTNKVNQRISSENTTDKFRSTAKEGTALKVMDCNTGLFEDYFFQEYQVPTHIDYLNTALNKNIFNVAVAVISNEKGYKILFANRAYVLNEPVISTTTPSAGNIASGAIFTPYTESIISYGFTLLDIDNSLNVLKSNRILLSPLVSNRFIVKENSEVLHSFQSSPYFGIEIGNSFQHDFYTNAMFYSALGTDLFLYASPNFSSFYYNNIEVELLSGNFEQKQRDIKISKNEQFLYNEQEVSLSFEDCFYILLRAENKIKLEKHKY